VRRPGFRENAVVGFEVDVVKKGSYLGDKPGDLRIRIMPTSYKEGTLQTVDEKARKRSRPSPVAVQDLRLLQPIIRDLVRDLRVKFTFETYAPPRCSFAMRGYELEGVTKEVDLLDVDHRNLDRGGGNFFDNEEALLDMTRWWLDSPTMRTQLEYANVNKRLPLMMLRAGAIWVPPSRALYERYVKGVKLDFGEKGGVRTASFEEVGYRPKEGDQPEPKPASP
jgi:hypothetical protein